MTGSWAIDTNVLIAILKGEPAALRHWDEADQVLVPAIVVGEALFGMKNSAGAVDNERRLWAALRWTQILVVDHAACVAYATIKLDLKRRGQPIPEADLWIAACCLAGAVPLASRDAHFEHVNDLVLNEWR